MTSTPEVKEALDWMTSYGLWGDTDFDEKDGVSSQTITNILKRFYAYYGTEEKDDFYAYVNHDYLYGEEGDDHKPDDEYVDALVLDAKKTQENYDLYLDELKGSPSTSGFYLKAEGYAQGTLEYSFLDLASTKDEIASIRSFASLADWEKNATDSLINSGRNDLFIIKGDPDMEDKETGLALRVEADVLAASCVNASSSDNKETAGNAYSLLGLADGDIESLSSSFASLFEKAGYLERTEFSHLEQMNEPYYDLATGKDLFAANDIAIDFKGMAEKDSLSLEGLSQIVTHDAAPTVSIGKAISEATASELSALSLYGFVQANSVALRYQTGTAQDPSLLSALVESNLTSDYAKSPYYQTVISTVSSLFNSVKSVFSSRIDSSSWLSIEGKAAIKEKMAAMGYNVMGEDEKGERTDLHPLSESDTLDQMLNKKSEYLTEDMVRLLGEGRGDKALFRIISPFYGNAMYLASWNTINISFGGTFFLGYDWSQLSMETLFGKIGMIIGHEMTHGFDVNGIKYDKDGKKTQQGIIPSADAAKFQELSQGIQSMFLYEEAVPARTQDSSLTVSENIADIGGLTFMEEMGRSISGFSYPDFYTAVVSGFAMKATLKTFMSTFREDNHAFGRARIDPILYNSGTFQDTFGLVEGDAMYMDPSARIVIW